MASLSIPNTFVTGNVITASGHNQNNSAIQTYVNDRNSGTGTWDNANATAATIGTATVTTATITTETVTTSAITNLTIGTVTLPAIGTTVLSGSWDGWIASGITWTYASASTFTIVGDFTTILNIGDKLKLTQTTAKYFYVTGVSYSAPNTTVTVTGGTDYTLANAAITLPFYSKMTSPNLFPTWFTYNCVSSGWAATPTQTRALFRMVGKEVMLNLRVTGTSNATTTVLLAPIAAVNSGDTWHLLAEATDNSAVLASFAVAVIVANSTTINCFSTRGSGSWTGSATKVVSFVGSYTIT